MILHLGDRLTGKFHHDFKAEMRQRSHGPSRSFSLAGAVWCPQGPRSTPKGPDMTPTGPKTSEEADAMHRSGRTNEEPLHSYPWRFCICMAR